MAYVPPKRTIPVKQLSMLALVLVIVVSIYMGYRQWNAQNEPFSKDEFTICDMTKEQTDKRLQALQGEPFAVSDYMFYGESLNLYQNSYAIGQGDPVNRKNVELTNLCDNETVTYTMEDSVDRKIDLRELPAGMYAMTINDQQVKKRLVFSEQLQSEPFTTIRRNGNVKEVRLLANAGLTAAPMQNHVLLLEVKEQKPEDDIADVFIDPYGPRLVNGVVNPAGSANGLDEAVEMQKAAQLLKEKLEAYGLRVVIANERAEDAMGYYGSDSIMEKAYASKAKYYLELGMSASQQPAVHGLEIYHSEYASATLANALAYGLKKNTSLQASNAYTWAERSEGVSSTTLSSSTALAYDAFPSIRESGGAATGAASMDVRAKQNASFALNTQTGMYALSINFIYITNSADAALWRNDRDAILTELTAALVTALHVSE